MSSNKELLVIRKWGEIYFAVVPFPIDDDKITDFSLEKT
ncbi:hypothetical protein BHECKSOX2_262 [Bathymodiolus heckerae thiotrophic gill symbiont]|nr:hypothetical protein BHECKSOX2_262 [Bathymodiolus heckerae thiotrophic gill symbiont]SMN15422.1 hypothetical protein CRYPD_522 [uncultured Candidatus Thioglobus sp.]